MTDEPVPPEGWHVRITLDDGTVLRPDVVGDPLWEPSVRDKPEAEIPVADNRLWETDRVDDADATVWLDGQQLPLDTLAETNTSGSNPPELTITGGDELDRRVQLDVGNKQTYKVARDLIQDETSLVADVDTPPSDPISQIIQDSLDVFDAAIDPSTPVERADGSLTVQQSSFLTTTDEFTEGIISRIDSSDPIYKTSEGGEAHHLVAGRGSSVNDLDTTVPRDSGTVGDNISARTDGTTSGQIVLFDADGNELTEIGADTEYNSAEVFADVAKARLKGTDTEGYTDTVYVNSAADGTGATTGQTDCTINQGNAVQLTVDPPYPIPASAVRLALRVYAVDPPVDPGGFEVGIFEADSFGPPKSKEIDNELFFEDQYGWKHRDISDIGDWSGSRSLVIELIDDGETGKTAGEDGGVVIDAAVVYDNRLSHSFDNDPTGSPPRFATPAPYAPVSVQAEQHVGPRGIDGATVTLSIDDTSNGQQIGMSTDGGSTFATQSNTDQATFDFGSSEEAVTPRVTLDGYGTQSESPQQKPNPQSISAYELELEVTNIARTINEGWDADIDEILRELADDADAIWTLEQQSGGMAVVWTQPGQRTSSDVLDPTAWSLTRDSREIVDAATVIGSRKSRSGETHVVETVGDPIPLDRERLIAGTETVTGDAGVYTPAEDYHLRPQSGELVPLSIGSITAGEELTVDYDYKVSGRYESDAWDGDPTADTTATITGLPTPTACQQAAEQLVSRASEARLEARVNLSDLDPTQSVAEAVNIDPLQDLGPWRVRKIERGTDEPVLTLGRGTTVEEETALLRSSIGTLEDRT